MPLKLSSLAKLTLAVAFCTTGCDRDKTSEKLEDVKADAKNNLQEMKDYTFAERAEFADKMTAQLAAINRNIDELDAKIAKSTDALRDEAKPKLQALREKSALVIKQLDLAKGSTETTWDSIKIETKKAYEALKDGFQQSRQWVSDKIAP